MDVIKLTECPHCNIKIEILELNCRIFRCGVYKHNLENINPHLSKEECDKLVEENLIYGCSKPFIIIGESNNIYISEKCDYI